jgi:hypothetical protein
LVFLASAIFGLFWISFSQKEESETEEKRPASLVNDEFQQKRRELNERFNLMGMGRQLRHHRNQIAPQLSQTQPVLSAVKFAQYDIALQAPRKSEKVVITLVSDAHFLEKYQAQKATLECYARRYNYEFLVLNPLETEDAPLQFFFLKHRAVAEAMAQHPEYQVFVCSPFFFTFLFISVWMWLV